jgi:outer membrane receptor protein involved in Fe transport
MRFVTVGTDSSAFFFRVLLILCCPLTAVAQAVDTVIVTAGRTEQQLINAPAATTVISDAAIERTPADDIGDLLRNVPGVNVAQSSARDINVTARGATKTLANSQLVLLDGRSVYLDFFGIVMWDLMPMQIGAIERIEVVRGPGSAVWGANAMSGVTNIITRRPADSAGTTIVLGTPGASVMHADGDQRFAYQWSGGFFMQRPYPRPTGRIPGSQPAQDYPAIDNEGTMQRRLRLRLDWGLAGGDLSIATGAARTDGIMHTGIGPFDIDNGTGLSFVQADWRQGEARIGLSAQWLDGSATNLVTRSAGGTPLGFGFVNDSYNLDLTNTSAIGERHLLTYGGNLRRHRFRLDIAPAAGRKDELGAFLQDEILLGRRLRWLLGLRYDDIDPLDHAVLTPRTSLLYSVAPGHSLRLSYNEAFRTPSAINHFLDVTILQTLGDDAAVPAHAVGNRRLDEETLGAVEIGYTGFLANGIGITASVYRNQTHGSIDFFVADWYGATNLPKPDALLPAALIPCFAIPAKTQAACPGGGLADVVPATYAYRNIGSTIDRGAELAFEQDLDDWQWWANLSWQDDPRLEGTSREEVNRAPRWRVNVGLSRDTGRFFWNATLNYQDASYWADVLFARAETASFTQINASLGWRFPGQNIRFELVAQNLLDRRLQQHIFGDIIERKLAARMVLSL